MPLIGTFAAASAGGFGEEQEEIYSLLLQEETQLSQMVILKFTFLQVQELLQLTKQELVPQITQT